MISICKRFGTPNFSTIMFDRHHGNQIIDHSLEAHFVAAFVPGEY